MPLSGGGQGARSDAACMICFEKTADHVMIPCGHGGYCAACASKLFHSKGQPCAVCRGRMSAIVRVPVDTPVGRRARVVPVHACDHRGQDRTARLRQPEQRNRRRDSEIHDWDTDVAPDRVYGNLDVQGG